MTKMTSGLLQRCLIRAPCTLSRLLHTATYSNKHYIKGNGFVGISRLVEPKDFLVYSQEAIQTCDQLIQKISKSQNLLNILYDLDDISNTLCRVMDASELCRNVHSNEEFRRNADQAYNIVNSYMQRLNANKDLYWKLKNSFEETNKNSLKNEQTRMAKSLLDEFERGGVHLTNDACEQVIKHQENIASLSKQFQQNAVFARKYVKVPRHILNGLPSIIMNNCPESPFDPDSVFLPTDPVVVDNILKFMPNPEVRKHLYLASGTCADENLEVLNKIVEERSALATTLGFRSYAEMTLSDKILKSPNEVYAFLNEMSGLLQNKVDFEKSTLSKLKSKAEANSQNLYEWDLPYYMNLSKLETFPLTHNISSFFSLSNCIEGIRMICEEVFGLRLQSESAKVNEIWHPSVTKYKLIHKTDGVIGELYMDLYPRESKYGNAAHFTIQCAKSNNKKELIQIPKVALVCNFSKAEVGATLLNLGEVESLFHEFGHALHSILSCSEFQHLSGTRTQLDFVETPSHLFEYFAWDYLSVREFATHYDTTEPITEEAWNNIKKARAMYSGINIQTQIRYSMFDMMLFDSRELPASFDIQKLALETHEKYGCTAPVDGMNWYTRFNHLIGYGAGYYSYLYARVFASSLYSTLFSGNPYNRESGRLLKDQMLGLGNTKAPEDMVKSILGSKPSVESLLKEIGALN